MAGSEQGVNVHDSPDAASSSLRFFLLRLANSEKPPEKEVRNLTHALDESLQSFAYSDVLALLDRVSMT